MGFWELVLGILMLGIARLLLYLAIKKGLNRCFAADWPGGRFANLPGTGCAYLSRRAISLEDFITTSQKALNTKFSAANFSWGGAMTVRATFGAADNFLIGAGAQLGCSLLCCGSSAGLYAPEAAAIGIIGGADGPQQFNAQACATLAWPNRSNNLFVYGTRASDSTADCA
jgi:Na+-transporting methylmalonyl-CoA/oxaloacetate decarboxylase beta subunit